MFKICIVNSRKKISIYFDFTLYFKIYKYFLKEKIATAYKVMAVKSEQFSFSARFFRLGAWLDKICSKINIENMKKI